MRRDDEHQFRAVALEGGAAEQRAEHRDFAQAGEGLDVGGRVVFDQTADGKALAVEQLYRGAGAARGERGQHRRADAVAGDADTVRVQVRHFRRHAQVDAAAFEHGRGELDGDAEFFSSSVMVVPPLPPPWATGMKILPPARKLASWPLMAISVGSASTLTRPSFFWASRVRKLPFLLLKPSATLLLPLNSLDRKV